MQSHYRSNLRDVFFNLFEVFDIGNNTLGRGPFASFDEPSARATLINLAELCSTDLASTYAACDKDPPHCDAAGNVIVPDALKRAMRVYFEGEWHKLGVPTHLGGFGAPPSITWSAYELIAGSNAALGFYLASATIAKVIDSLGTERQRRLYAAQTVERCWGSAMVLTESDAGSDVGQVRTRAVHMHDDVWRIEGVKRFITNGDFDAAENIIHLVLARPEGASIGTKGLSMFIVPKYWVNDDGSLGSRNGFYCSNLERKMGIKASVTCEMVYGESTPALGLLVGNEHDGIRQMFHVIEWARMAVGVKSMAQLSTAYLNALGFAKERVQGADLRVAHIKSSPRVRIIQHPDVRRMLMTLKAHTEGMRALCLFAATLQDQVELSGGHGAGESRDLDALNDLLLPLVKGYCSEKAYELMALALQCFGGSGYLQDYPIEQYLRDQKIDSLYEGTTHIQALDLVLRKIMRDEGATLGGLFHQIRDTAAKDTGNANLDDMKRQLARAAHEAQALMHALTEKMHESVYHVGLHGNHVLFAIAELVVGWLLVRQAIVAQEKSAGSAPGDTLFYEGKMAAAKFYCEHVLPNIEHTRKSVESSRLDIMHVPEDAF